MHSTSLCSLLAGRYDNPIPSRFPSPHRLFKNSSSGASRIAILEVVSNVYDCRCCQIQIHKFNLLKPVISGEGPCLMFAFPGIKAHRPAALVVQKINIEQNSRQKCHPFQYFGYFSFLFSNQKIAKFQLNLFTKEKKIWFYTISFSFLWPPYRQHIFFN